MCTGCQAVDSLLRERPHFCGGGEVVGEVEEALKAFTFLSICSNGTNQNQNVITKVLFSY